jgi:hypothetical protein
MIEAKLPFGFGAISGERLPKTSGKDCEQWPLRRNYCVFAAITELHAHAVTVKVNTGDHDLVARKI